MKKFLILLLLSLASVMSFSQTTLWFRTTEFAYKSIDDYGRWTGWSDWEESGMNVKFDLSKDLIVIYSPDIQVYNVLEEKEPPYDQTGRQVKYWVINQDKEYGYLRLRIQDNGTSQIYVDFTDYCLVYNVIRIR